MAPDCRACRNSYDGADGVLRCRIHPRGLHCSPALAEDCRRFEYEPGTDADEPTPCAGCCGRGD